MIVKLSNPKQKMSICIIRNDSSYYKKYILGLNHINYLFTAINDRRNIQIDVMNINTHF